MLGINSVNLAQETNLRYLWKELWFETGGHQHLGLNSCLYQLVCEQG